MNTVDKKLILIDLDGTLLNSKGHITNFTKETIFELSKKGHLICIITGRSKRSALNYYNDLSLSTLMANHNSSLISNPSNKNFRPINFTFTHKIKNKILNHKSIMSHVKEFAIEAPNHLYVSSKEVPDWIKNYLYANDRKIKKVISKKSGDEVDPYAIIFELENDDGKIEYRFSEIEKAIKEISPILCLKRFSTHGKKTILFEINVGINKGHGLKIIANYYGYKYQDAYTFGNDWNDIEMLKLTKESYAMKNSIENKDVINAAKKITKFTNDEDGVAKELRAIKILW